jgi:hypothetical protein
MFGQWRPKVGGKFRPHPAGNGLQERSIERVSGQSAHRDLSRDRNPPLAQPLVRAYVVNAT